MQSLTDARKNKVYDFAKRRMCFVTLVRKVFDISFMYIK